MTITKDENKLRSPPCSLAVMDGVILGGAFFTCASIGST
jgi:hypothetical protein